jgi:hypothetical protein
MNRFLLGIGILPLFFTGAALASQPLSDEQLDRVTAGQSTACSGGAGCTTPSTTVGGVTTVSSSTGFQITIANPGPANLQAILQSFYAYLQANAYPAHP